MTMIRSLAVAATAAFALVGASADATTTLHFTQGGLFNNRNVTLAGPGVGNGQQTAANFRLQGTQDGSVPVDILAFCVDLLNQITLGNNEFISVNYKYEVSTLTSAAGGDLLTTAQLDQMKGLANLGFKLIKMGDPDLKNKIPAIQAAIWSIEYGKTATSNNATVQGFINDYIALAPSLSAGNVFYIKSTDATVRQGLFASYVPEPGTWVMLIAGFGLIGAAARRRRGIAVAAA